MKRIFALFAVIVTVLSAMTASAQETTKAVKVNLHDGTSEVFKFLDNPSLTVEDHQLVLRTATVESSYPIENVSHFSFEEVSTQGIDESAIESNFIFSFTGNTTVTVSSPTLENVDLYSLDGIKMGSARAIDHTAVLNISSYPAGPYIVVPNGHSPLKIIKQ